MRRLQMAAAEWLARSNDDDLVVEQYRNLRPQVPTMYIAVFVNVLFLTFVTASGTRLNFIDLPLVMATLIVMRLAYWRLTKLRTRAPSVVQMRRSMAGTVLIAAATSGALSLWSQAILANDNAPGRTYVALFTALCTISCAACLSSLPLAAYIVVGVGTVPVSIALLLTGDTMLMSRGANLLLISPLVLGMIYRQHQQLRRMVKSRGDIVVEQLKAIKLAHHDPLTGLSNRRAFLEELKTASSGPGHSALAVGIIDLDGFKIINDTYGHQTGDALLIETARRCQQLGMGDALIARFGGDEFAVLLRGVSSLEHAQHRLATLLEVFEPLFVVDSQSFRMTASIGLAHNITNEGTTMELVNRADLAMYEAKRASSTTIAVFEPLMEAQARRRIVIQQGLSNRAELNRIDLRYQPVFTTATNQIVAFEALARWTHPLLGIIPPAEFIPIAEQAGMTEPMTTHLLSLALRTASTWPVGIGLSFNLSAAELNSPGLAGRLLRTVARHHFDPQNLSIEVTETALLRDFTAARAVLGELQEGGVRVLLDDFGAGFASIGYLREIRFDGVKLDGSLIATLTENPAACDLLSGVLDLCKAIGAPVTAEMVETEAQYELLRTLRVAHVQGYWLSRPLAADQTLDACQAIVIKALQTIQ